VEDDMQDSEWDDVARILGDVQFPANRQDIINHARARQATEHTLALIRELPVGVYRNLMDVRISALARGGSG
jgi:hypothetical protein